MTPRMQPESIVPEEQMLHFKLFTIWRLDEKYASVKKSLLSFRWSRNLQIGAIFEAISKLYPFWKREEIRIYGRCGKLFLPISDYITMTTTLRHMATYASDVLYLVKTELKTEIMMTVEELKERWHVRKAKQKEEDFKLIKRWVGNQGYEGRSLNIRAEHIPPEEQTILANTKTPAPRLSTPLSGSKKIVKKKNKT